MLSAYVFIVPSLVLPFHILYEGINEHPHIQIHIPQTYILQ